MAGEWLVKEGRVRAFWRILLYLVLLRALYVPTQLVDRLLPRSPLDLVGYLLLTATGLIAGWVVLVRCDGRAPGALGFAFTSGTVREIVLGFAVGSGLISVASALLFLTGSARFVPDTGSATAYVHSLLLTLAFFIAAAANEEVWFRGYVFQALVESLGAWPAVLGTSALFALAHLWNPNVDAIALGNIFLAGVLIGLAYLRTRSLWLATALHAGWNWTMASAIGFPVSGLVLRDTPLYDAIETGADWWTGGPFGPEAGLAGTLVLLVGTAWVLRTGALREPPEMRALRPLVDTRLAEVGA